MNASPTRLLNIVLAWLMLGAAAFAQGFAGLGAGGEGFAQPSPDTVLQFPRDHGAHPDFRIEWWYLTANLQGPDGTDYGVQWTVFRAALAPEDRDDWSSPQLWMGNAAVTTPKAHLFAQRLARGRIGQAGASAAPFDVWIDEWRMWGDDPSRVRLMASGSDFAYDLSLTADGPLTLQGASGYSVKSAGGQASHYYSQPFYEVSGNLTLPGGVVPVTGQAWMDREWSSQPLADTQKGWDWISLHLDDGSKLMAFQLQQTDGGAFSSGSWIAPDGTVSPFSDGAIEMTPLDWSDVAGRRVPTRWRVVLPQRGVDIELAALNPDSWMDTLFPYWEGPVRFSGSHSGRGYLEMTGY